MKISRANTDMLKRALALNSKLVAKTDKNLYDRMKYTSDAIKKGAKVTRTDLADLLNDVKTVLGKNFIDPVMAEEMKTEQKVETPAPATKATVKSAPKKESSLKKTTKKEDATTEALKAAAKALEKKQEAEKKTAPAKKVTKTEKVTPVEPVSAKERPLAKYFPKTIEVEGETYECARNVKTMKDIRDLLNADRGDDLIFAFYWSERHLAQFEYFDGILEQPKQFKDDLDLCGIVYVSDSDKVMYAVSMYAEAVYTIYPHELKEEKEGLRFAAGLEYQIYLKTEKKEEAPAPKTEEVTEEPAPAPKATPKKAPAKKAPAKAEVVKTKKQKVVRSH